MHFGIYLRNKGLISSDELINAFERQQNRLIPIGQLALERGVMSVRSVFKVLRQQSDTPMERFGETAIDMGLLNEENLTRLLMEQMNRQRPVGELLVEQGTLSPDQLIKEMTAFRRDRERWGTQTKTSVIRNASQEETSNEQLPVSELKTSKVMTA